MKLIQKYTHGKENPKWPQCTNPVTRKCSYIAMDDVLYFMYTILEKQMINGITPLIKAHKTIETILN